MILPSWVVRGTQYFESGYDKWPKVYFIGAKEGPVKIGRAVNVAKRLNAIQTGNPEKLMILASAIEGDIINEKSLHEKYAGSRIRGEWFRRTPNIQQAIDWLKEGDRLTLAQRLSRSSFSIDLDWMALCVYAGKHGVRPSRAEEWSKDLTDEQILEIVEIKHRMPL